MLSIDVFIFCYCRDFCLDLLLGTEVVLDYYVGAVVRKFKISGLSKHATCQLTFTKQPGNVEGCRVTEYFKEKYDKDIVWKLLPCLILKSSKGKVYVPMELAKLSPSSRFMGTGLMKGKEFQFQNSLRNPDSRCKRIADMMEEFFSVDIHRPTRYFIIAIVS